MRLLLISTAFAFLMGGAVAADTETAANDKPSKTKSSDTAATETILNDHAQKVRQRRHHGDLWDDVVGNGSPGINAMFGKLHGVDPVEYTPAPDRAVTEKQRSLPAAPVSLPQPSSSKPWELVATEGGPSNSNGSVCHYAWKVVVRNNTDAEIVLSGDVDFVDADDHPLEEARIVAMRVAAHSEQAVTGSTMMMADSAQSVVRPRARLEQR